MTIITVSVTSIVSCVLNYKDIKILRPITIITIFCSVMVFVQYSRRLIISFREPENPLIPKFVSNYMAFPSYFILPLFFIIILICYLIIRRNKFDYRIVYFLFGFVLVFFFFSGEINQFLLSKSPYATP